MARNRTTGTATTDKIAGASATNPNGFSGITIVGWVNSTLANGFFGTVSAYNLGGALGVYYKGIGSNHGNAFYTLSTAVGQSVTGSATLNNGSWNHLAVTGTVSGIGQGYANGATDGSSFTAPAAFQSVTTYVVGQDGSTGDGLLGSAADCAVWNTALTAFEIKAIANGARPYQIRPANLVQWWPLDGLQSPEPDLSGKANNGTITGTIPLSFGPPVAALTPRWPIYAPFRTTVTAVSSFLAARAMRANQVYTGYATQ